MEKTMEQLIESHLHLKLTNLIDVWLELLEQQGVAPDLAVVETLKQAINLTTTVDAPPPHIDLATAATMLLDEYQHNNDLTAFTSLDSEAFFSNKWDP